MRINLRDARKGLHEKCYELFTNKHIAEHVYRYLCDGIEDCAEADPNSCKYWDSESKFCALSRPQAELIDRNSVLRLIRINIPEEIGAETYEKIRQLPIIEAEPIKHGRWETVRAYPNVIMCSECNTPYERREFVAIPNYCPNCGADMRGGENGID